MRTRRGAIGVDPAYAKPNAVAVWLPDGRWEFGEFAADDLTPWRELLERHKGLCEVVAIEGGYVGVNRKVSLLLERVRGRIQAYAEAGGYEVHIVPIQTWVSATLTQGCWTPKTHTEIVAQARRRALGVTRRHVTEDQSVALCLAEHAAWLPPADRGAARVLSGGSGGPRGW